jgi:hypothetical protein
VDGDNQIQRKEVSGDIMISIELMGGVGNLLFQVATAYAHSKRVGDECYLDLSRDIISCTPHYNNLSVYKDNIFRNFKNHSRMHHQHRHEEPSHRYSPIPRIPNLFLFGYFQSDKYFSDYADEIKSLVSPKQEELDYIIGKYKDILDMDTVSVHVRRGDYLKFNASAVLPIDYYKRALSLFPNKKVVVFSDDIQYCKNEFGSDATYITGERDYIDIYIMSRCKNNIISNSSFSWWGSYLNNHHDKKVVAPKLWNGHYTDNPDIYCSNWITI